MSDKSLNSKMLGATPSDKVNDEPGEGDARPEAFPGLESDVRGRDGPGESGQNYAPTGTSVGATPAPSQKDDSKKPQSDNG